MVPPDEFAMGFPLYSGVSDSVYTNAGAIITALLAIELNEKDPRVDAWSNLAAHLTILTEGEDVSLWHPEYEGFPEGNTYYGGKVKQADVIMLAFPLNFPNLSATSIRNDIKKYEPLYDPEGPAMTKSISVIDWLQVNETLLAAKYLANSTLNIQRPFNVWTESSSPNQHSSAKDMGCYNFMTGGGGFIQSIVHGYGGVRYLKNAMRLMPILPPSDRDPTTPVSQFKLRGLTYKGTRFDVELTQEKGTVVVVYAGSVPLKVLVAGTERPLSIGSRVPFLPHQPIEISPTQ